MDKQFTPDVFCHLLSKGIIKPSDILQTQDGFWMVYKSLADILLEKGITEFQDSDGRRLECSKFYDDWFLYAVPDGDAHTYSLLKLREQEHDLEDGTIADGDTPGVTISFIAFSCGILTECLANASDANRTKLDEEINRVVARRGQRHHAALKRYFKNPRTDGAYLVADRYAKHIALFAENGCLAVPEYYGEIVQQSLLHKTSARRTRLPRFIAALNHAAGHTVCDNETIYLENPEAPTEYEAAAILATHTGNTSPVSFAAEVEYHARFLTPLVRIPLFGRSVYESAIRADMTISDPEFEGPAPFYRSNSRIVKRQRSFHPAHAQAVTLDITAKL